MDARGPAQDRQVGVDEFGRPVYAGQRGTRYTMTEQPRVSAGETLADLAGAFREAPGSTVSNIARSLASGAWNAIEAPGNALRGETMTFGDIADTAGMAQLGAAAMPAPRGALRSGALRSADETPAQAVARLLREGRGSEVTDDLMAQADPQEMFRLYTSGATGADMPMDEASRMARAREMGLRNEFHGTTTGSEMTYADAFRGSGSRQGIGFVTSDNPYVASSYADPSFGSVFPMMNPILPEEAPRINAGGNVWSDISVNAPVQVGAREIPARQLTYEPADVGGVLSTNQLSRGASFDYPGIEFSNILDRSIHAPRPSSDDGMDIMRSFQQLSSEPSTVTMRHDTRGMRSRFARFDPRLSHLRNLSAGVAGAGIALPYLSGDPEATRTLQEYIQGVQ